MAAATSTDPPVDTDSGGLPAPRPDQEPSDRCVRCGKPTPAGAALCAEHNPGRLRGPSSTQMHATVFAGIVVGVIGLFVLLRFATGSPGPFLSRVLTATADGAGGVALTFSITNEGAGDAAADCRVTRDGVPRPDDLALRSPVLAAGETVTFDRTLSKGARDPIGYVADAVSVICG